MNTSLFASILLALFAVQTIPNSWALTEQEKEQFAKKMTKEQLMCSQDVCVTEDDLYRERGPMIYSLEDTLYFQKYEMAKNLILQKIIEKKIAGTGDTFADYHRKIVEQIKISDQEVKSFLDKNKVTEITPNTPEFFELKNKLVGDRIHEHYLKVFNEYKGKKDIIVNIERKPRQSVKLPFDQLINFQLTKGDDLKVTLVANPSRTELRSLLEVVDSIAGYQKKINKKISWYFLPFTDGSAVQKNYEKLFICSMKTDQGKSIRETLEMSKPFENDLAIFAFLKKRKFKTEPLQTCFNSKATEQNVEKLNTLIRTSNISTIPQVIYDNQVEFRIPGMIELKERVDLKLKIKALVKRDLTKALM